MESFEVQIGEQQRKLIIEPVRAQESETTPVNNYRIFAKDSNSEWLSKDSAQDVPTGNYLGSITVNSDKDFTFDGGGDFSGNDLLAIAAQITRHPSFSR